MSIEHKLAAALSQHQSGHLSEAKQLYDEILQQDPTHADALHLLGMISDREGDIEKAIALIEKAIIYNPESPVYQNNIGTIYESKEDFTTAESYYRQALSQSAHYADAANNLGNVLMKQEDYDGALKVLQETIEMHPAHVKAQFNLAKLYQIRHEFELALKSYLNLLQIDPNYLPAYINLGSLLHAQRKLDDAYNCFHYVVTANPEHSEGHYNLALTLISQGKITEALTHLTTAHALNHNHLKTLIKLAECYLIKDEIEKAVHYSNLAHSIDPNHTAALALYSYSLLHIADWPIFEVAAKKLSSLVAHELKYDIDTGLTPKISWYIFDDAETIQSVTRNYVRQLTIANQKMFQYDIHQDGRIHIGYVSENFLSFQMQPILSNIFSYHDRSRFHITLYNLNPEPLAIESKVYSSVDQVINLYQSSYIDAVKLINQDKIQILIDLSGLEKQSWPQIFAARPAPIQCHYLGHSGTQGNKYMDYIITHPTESPENIRRYYDERCAMLSQSPLVIESMPTVQKDRIDYQLPSNAIVFCCFHPVSRIDPQTFATWMTILSEVENSVLWLHAQHPLQQQHLIKSAQRCDIPMNRLIFNTEQNPLQSSAIAHADIALDTFRISGGLHQCSAYWFGVPVLTLAGCTAPSCFGASLAYGANTADLIVDTPEAYIALAKKLATDHVLLKEYAQHLQQRDNLPLFQPQRFITDLEFLFEKMWQRHAENLPPTDILITKT